MTFKTILLVLRNMFKQLRLLHSITATATLQHYNATLEIFAPFFSAQNKFQFIN